MNFKKTYWALLLLLGLSATSEISAKSSEGFVLTNQNMMDLIQHLVCNYDIQLTESELESWLSGLLSGAEGCKTVEASMTGMAKNSNSFEWRPVRDANGYLVSSLGLDDGRKTAESTKNAMYSFTDLSFQPYIFSFITDCIVGSNSSAYIIIIDKDVFYTGQVDATCDCDKVEIVLEEDLSCQHYSDFEIYNFDWANSGGAKKYQFKIDATIDGDSETRKFWVIKGYNSEEGVETIGFLPDCDESYYNCGWECQGLGDENFNVNFSQSGVHIFITNPSFQVLNIEGEVCGYDQQKSPSNRLVAPHEQFDIFPNPAHNELTIQLPISENPHSRLTIYNAQGQLIENRKVDTSIGNHSFIHSIASYPNGFYFFKISSDQKEYTQKILKL